MIWFALRNLVWLALVDAVICVNGRKSVSVCLKNMSFLHPRNEVTSLHLWSGEDIKQQLFKAVANNNTSLLPTLPS